MNELQLSEAQQSRVIESLVVRGDVSGLSPQERASYYVALCRQLGLNPATHPLQFLRLNGKEVLYPTRGATDQLAAMHALNRETLEGPEVRKFGSVDLLYCKVRVTLPNGRSETAIATLAERVDGNSLMKCECVPLDTEILTQRGFKKHDEIKLGELVLAYDCQQDKCEWVPLENITTYTDVPVFRLHTERNGFSFRCTYDHSWAVDTRSSAGRLLVEARSIKTTHRLRIAAPAISGDHPLSEADAAILGWVMTDGTIKRVGNYVSLIVYQSKPKNVEEIRALFKRSGLAHREDTGKPTVRTFPGGNTSECLPQSAFCLSADESRALLFRAGIESPADMPRLVTRLSAPARSAMFRAMMAADATAKGRFGKKRKPGVMEAWTILATLEGIALGIPGMSSVGEVPTQQALSYNYVAGSNLSLTPDGVEPVWCPTTKHGTWVARQSGRISITGNTKAKRRATLSILGLGMLDETEIESIPADVKQAVSQPDVAGYLEAEAIQAEAPQDQPTLAQRIRDASTLDQLKALSVEARQIPKGHPERQVIAALLTERKSKMEAVNE